MSVQAAEPLAWHPEVLTERTQEALDSVRGGLDALREIEIDVAILEAQAEICGLPEIGAKSVGEAESFLRGLEDRLVVFERNLDLVREIRVSEEDEEETLPEIVL